jgi:hypothetical protein
MADGWFKVERNKRDRYLGQGLKGMGHEAENSMTHDLKA